MEQEDIIPDYQDYQSHEEQEQMQVNNVCVIDWEVKHVES